MSQPYIGEIRLFGGNFAPLDWATCDGQLMSIANNNALFALIGTTYGGDGVNTFALPDLRGRGPIHQGTGQALSTYVIGQNGGTETVQISTAQMPQHSHVVVASTTTANSQSPAGNVTGAGPPIPPSSQAYLYADGGTPAQLGNLVAGTVGNAYGGPSPHENMMPFLTVTYIISLFGIFPSQN